jgi:hypothetical protein
MCSTLRKAPCIEDAKCSWVVGKGCSTLKEAVAKAAASMAAKKSKNPPVPQNVGKHAETDNFWYAVGYSPSNRATCHGCKQKIAKDELRIARHQNNPFGDNDMIKFFHADHAFAEFAKARCSSALIKWDTLGGSREITETDKLYVYERINQLSLLWAKKCKDKVTKK